MTQLVNQVQSIPVDLVHKRSPSKNFKFVLGGLLLIGLVMVLIVSATFTTGAYYMTVTEIKQAAPGIVGERVRVNGNVVEGSEDWQAQEVTLRFSISDEGGAQLPIVFYGPRPDNFQRAASAIIEGQLLPDGTFQADTLLLKCPSRYEEEPEQVYIESTH